MLQVSLTVMQMQRHTNRGGAVEQDENRYESIAKHEDVKIGYLSASSQGVGLFINSLTRQKRRKGRKGGKIECQ
jgi:hypothetical protein